MSRKIQVSSKVLDAWERIYVHRAEVIGKHSGWQESQSKIGFILSSLSESEILELAALTIALDKRLEKESVNHQLAMASVRDFYKQNPELDAQRTKVQRVMFCPREQDIKEIVALSYPEERQQGNKGRRLQTALEALCDEPEFLPWRRYISITCEN